MAVGGNSTANKIYPTVPDESWDNEILLDNQPDLINGLTKTSASNLHLASVNLSYDPNNFNISRSAYNFNKQLNPYGYPNTTQPNLYPKYLGCASNIFTKNLGIANVKTCSNLSHKLNYRRFGLTNSELATSGQGLCLTGNDHDRLDTGYTCTLHGDQYLGSRNSVAVYTN